MYHHCAGAMVKRNISRIETHFRGPRSSEETEQG
jgi:hypothetical protein